MVENNFLRARGKRLKLNRRSRGSLELGYIYGFSGFILLLDEFFNIFLKERFRLVNKENYLNLFDWFRIKGWFCHGVCGPSDLDRNGFLP